VNRAHAWFAGWAPAADPELAIVVLVEHGGGGGKNAAPIAIEALKTYLGDGEQVEAAPTNRAGSE
jgi:penicillin-binding protein 2